MPPLGAHMSIAGGYYRAAEEARRCECDCVQLFTKNNNQWRAKTITDEEALRFADSVKQQSLVHPLAHSSYLINLASPDAALRQKSIESMIVELQRAAQLGIPFVVVHPGSHTIASEEEGLANVAASLDLIHKALPKTPVQVLLEITAGQGSNLGWQFEQLATIISLVKDSSRLGICFDTCHAFAAGYDLRDAKAYKAMWRSFDKLLGLDRLKAIHLNDSKRELGSRVDRHEHIGRGQIGAEGFCNLLRDRRFRDMPMYLETPKGEHQGQSWDIINLRTLRQICRG